MDRTEEEYNSISIEIFFRRYHAPDSPQVVEESRLIIGYLWPNPHYQEASECALSRVSLATWVTAWEHSTCFNSPSPSPVGNLAPTFIATSLGWLRPTTAPSVDYVLQRIKCGEDLDKYAFPYREITFRHLLQIDQIQHLESYCNLLDTADRPSYSTHLVNSPQEEEEEEEEPDEVPQLEEENQQSPLPIPNHQSLTHLPHSLTLEY